MVVAVLRFSESFASPKNEKRQVSVRTALNVPEHPTHAVHRGGRAKSFIGRGERERATTAARTRVRINDLDLVPASRYASSWHRQARRHTPSCGLTTGQAGLKP